jgi:hypothetical protein
LSASIVSTPAGSDHITSLRRRGTETNAVAEQMAHCPAWIGERGFRRAVRIEPGALDGRDHAVKIGDSGKKGRPGLQGSAFAFAVVGRRVEAKGGPVERTGDAAGAQISLGKGAGDRTAGAKQAPGGVGRFGRDGREGGRRRFRLRQGEKGAGFVEGFG